MRRIAFISGILIMAASAAFAQAKQPIVRIAGFTGSGVSASEASTLERLIASYVVELKLFRVVDAQGQEMALSETETALSLGAATSASIPLSADYILSGSIGKIGDIFIFTLDNTRVSSGEKLTVSDTSHSISDIVLRSRDLTRSLFGKKDVDIASATTQATTQATGTAGAAATAVAAVPSSAAANATPLVAVNKAPTVADIVGTWRGDKGLETVRIFPNGTALAVLSGGGTLKLRITISGDAIDVTQDQPNDVAMYKASTVTLDIARRIAAQARPMRWIFSLSANGQSLSGNKESISISGSGASLQVDNSYVRDAAWTRISR